MPKKEHKMPGGNMMKDKEMKKKMKGKKMPTSDGYMQMK